MKIKQWKVNRDVITRTETAFRAGEHEVFAIWSAEHVKADIIDEMAVDGCIVPTQTPGVTAEGVWVHIEGRELQRIQLDNFKVGRRSVIQLHTHPGSDVCMSRLDRAWEVVRHVGALSIIVPHYCRFGLQLGANANVYEREEDDWRLWSPAEARERLVVA